MHSSWTRGSLRSLTVVFAALAALPTGCTRALPKLKGAPAVAPAPQTPWTGPAQTQPSAATLATNAAAEQLLRSREKWTLAEIVDLALRNNPATKAAWADARAAAAKYGSRKGAYYPTIELDAAVERLKEASSPGTTSEPFTAYGPTLNLSYLLLDFGGRSAQVEQARQDLLAADWIHNAVIQGVILNVEQAYYTYQATKALLRAQQATLEEAKKQLEAAETRHSVGVATIADVLQAQTALSRVQLTIQTIEGAIRVTRGALAVAMGVPANIEYDVEDVPKDVPIEDITAAVDGYILEAMAKRPELAAARAAAASAHAKVRQMRSDRLPYLTTSGNLTRYYVGTDLPGTDTYTISLQLRIPLFTGFSATYDLMQAQAQAEAADARLGAMENQVVYQVWSAYYELKTSVQRARTSTDLLASATQSHEVALARYKEGVGSILDVLAAEATLADARSQYIQARWDWYSSLAQLAHDTGVLGLQSIETGSSSPEGIR